MKTTWCTQPRVRSSAFLNEVLLFLLPHLLKLEVPCMRRRTKFPSLKNDEENGADDRNEVEWQIHEVANNSFGREFSEWLRHEFTQFGHWIASPLDLTLRSN